VTVILGVRAGSHNSSAALIADGDIVAAVNEGRFSRIKRESRFPSCAINYILDEFDKKIDHIALSTNASPPIGRHLRTELRHLTEGSFDFNDLLAKVSVALERMQAGSGDISRMFTEETVLEEGDVERIETVDHHLAHAASAYFTSGFDEATTVTVDAAGDGLSSTVSVGRDGSLSKIASNDYVDSIGRLWAQLPTVFGFKGAKHAGKFMGLAPYADDVPESLQEEVESLFRVDGLDIVNEFQRKQGGVDYAKNVKALRDRFRTYEAPEVAHALQRHTEATLETFLDNAVRKTGIDNVALAGGVFANVKVNQQIWELDSVGQLFVHPDMSDGGLALGSALKIWSDVQADVMPKELGHVYYGPEYGRKSIEAAIEQANLPPAYNRTRYADINRLSDRVGHLLNDGAVVAVFRGSMEYGPRALGNRSILYQPTDPSCLSWLNRALDRTEFMPFAPVTKREAASNCYVDVDTKRCPAVQYMAIALDCTEEMKTRSPGAVHIDGTARPQIVDRDTNTFLHAVLTSYEERTGIPTLLNTSFNMHGEPLVCNPGEALDALTRSRLDALVIENTLITETEHES